MLDAKADHSCDGHPWRGGGSGGTDPQSDGLHPVPGHRGALHMAMQGLQMLEQVLVEKVQVLEQVRDSKREKLEEQKMV